MIEGNSPDWLPTGWTEQVKVTNGRKVKCYIDPLTGRKFYSKPQVSDYLRNVKHDSSASQTKKMGIASSNMGELTGGKTTLKPEGSQLRTRSSSKKIEMVFSTQPVEKLNMGELTGGRTSMKEEESHNVKTPKRTRCKSEKKQTSSLQPVVKLNMGEYTGGNTSPKEQESQNVKTPKQATWKSKQKQIGSSTQPLEKVVIERVKPDGLPPGWLKEIKIQKTANGSRKDPYYTDPVSGYVFFSRKDALRYLETGDFNSCSMKPKKRGELGFLKEETLPKMGQLTGGKTSLKEQESQNVKTPKRTSCTSERMQTGSSLQPAEEVMVERVTPDGLPPGWLKEIKIQKKANGTRKDPYYTDPVSGYVFFSRKDALRYLETGDFNSCSMKPKKRNELGFLKDETSPNMGGLTGAKHYPKLEGSPNVKTPKRTSRTSKCKETDSTKKPVEKAVIETVAHDGLPPGWLKETYYTDPVSGYVFFSQKDALHYLETGDVDRCSIKPKKRDKLGFLNEETSPNKSELTGVKTSLKQEGSQNATTPKSTSRVAKRKQRGISEQSVEKSNVDELTGGKTSLKQEESRSARTPKRTSRIAKQKQMGKVGIERVTPDGLPPGWIKEIRIQTKANGTRKDMYYTDPISGYVFWSQKDALRYLEVGDFSQCSIKPKKRDELVFLNQESSLPSAATTQTLEQHTPKRQPFTGKQNNGTNSLETTDAGGPRKRQRILKGKKSLDNAIEECADTKESCDPSSSALPIPKGSKRKRGKRVGAENDTVSTPSTENKSNRKTRIDSSKSKKKKALSLPSRSSKRLVALNSGETEVEPLVGALDKATDSGHRQFQMVSETGITDNAFGGTEAPSNVKLLNTSKNPLVDQPIPQDQPVREEAGKKDEETQDHENPFGDTWSDPCLEFAFKTLSGEMPVEDTLPAQDNVQQQPDNPNPQTAGCLSLLDFGVPTFFQNNVVSEFDAPGKSVSSSRPTSAPFLASGNVSSLFFDTPAKPFSDSIPQLPTSPKFQASGNVSSPSCDALGQLPTSPRFGAFFDSPEKNVSPCVPQLRYSPVFQASGNVSSPVLDAPGKPVSDSAPQLPTNPSLLACGNAPQQPNLDENKEHQRNLNL